MNFLNLFSRKKENPVSAKEHYAPVLGDIWVCAFNFCPWDQEKHRVVYKKVGIVTARAYKDDGFYVETDFKNPFYSSAGNMTGFVNRLSIRHNCGFFETEDAAKKAYNDLMNKWIDVIKSTMENQK